MVDGRGNIYVTSIRFEFLAGKPPQSGIIALVTPDGKARQVAGDLAFPNGMVITPDNATLIVSESFAGRLSAFDIAADGSLSNRRVWAEGLAPDGICLDAEGAVWVGAADVRLASGRDDAPRGAVARIREVGAVLQISTATTPDLKGVKVAIGGGPALLKNGKPFPMTPPGGVSQVWSERCSRARCRR